MNIDESLPSIAEKAFSNKKCFKIIIGNAREMHELPAAAAADDRPPPPEGEEGGG